MAKSLNCKTKKVPKLVRNEPYKHIPITITEEPYQSLNSEPLIRKLEARNQYLNYQPKPQLFSKKVELLSPENCYEDEPTQTTLNPLIEEDTEMISDDEPP